MPHSHDHAHDATQEQKSQDTELLEAVKAAAESMKASGKSPSPVTVSALATEWASTVNSDGSETVRFRMAHRGPDRLAAELPRHCLSLSPSLLVIVCKDN